MRTLARVGIALLLLAGLLIVIVYCLLNTQAGSQRLLKTAIAKTGGDLELNNFRGSLLDGFSISTLTFSDQTGVNVVVNDLQAQWQLSFRHRELDVSSFTVDAIDITPGKKAPQTDQAQAISKPDFSLPGIIRVRSLKVNTINLHSAPEPVVLTDLATEFALVGSQLELKHFSLSGFESSVNASAEVDFKAPHQIQAAITALTKDDRFNGDLSIAGTLDQYQLTAQAKLFDERLPEVLANLTGAGTFDSLNIESLQLDSSDAKVVITGPIDWKEAPSANLKITAQNLSPALFKMQQQGQFDLDAALKINDQQHDFQAQLTGILSELPIELTLQATGDNQKTTFSNTSITSGPSALNAKGELSWADGLVAQIELDGSKLDPALLSAQVTGDLNLTGQIALAQSDYSGSLDLKGILNTQPTNVGITFKGNDQQVVISTASLTNGASELHANGEIELSSPLGANMNIDFNNFDPSIFVSNLNGSIAGSGQFTLNNDELSTTLNSIGTLNQVPIKVYLDVSGVTNDIRINTATLSSDESVLSVTGTASLGETLQADLLLNGSDFNPGLFFPEYPGKLNLNGNLTLIDDTFQSTLTVQGLLRGSKLSSDIELSGNSDEVELKKIDLVNGENTLSISGALDKQQAKQLSFTVNAPSLETIVPHLQGKLTGSGTINGDWQQIRGTAQLRGREVQYQDIRVESFSADLKPSLNQTQSINIAVSNIAIGTQLIAAVSIDADATLTEQKIKTSVTSVLGDQLKSQAIVRQITDAISIDIVETILQVKSGSSLKQRAPAQLTLANGKAELPEFCLEGSKEFVCIGLSKDATRLDSTITLSELPLQVLANWFTGMGKIKESISGQAKVENRDEQWNITTNLGLDDGSNLVAAFGLNTQDQTLNGNVKGSLEGLDWLALVSEELLETSGRVELDLDINGDVDRPQIDGEIALQQFESNLPALGVKLTDLNILTTASQNGVAEIKGTANTGEGLLNVAGDIRYLPLQDWLIKIQLSGDGVLVTDLPEYRVIASPELKIEVNNVGTTLTGSVEIPEALITLSELPEQATTVSEDTRIVNDDAKLESEKPSKLSATLDLTFGEKVQLQGKGLDVMLSGGLRISQKPGSEPSGTGAIDLSAGKYTAYGQNLTLENGTLLFSGPLADPGIQISAERLVEEQVVGLELSGTVNNLQSTIYSVPPIAQSDAISYLVTGKALGASRGSENAAMVKALTNFGIKGSASIINDIRTSTGLSTLEIEGGESIEETALLIGKYLTPELYVEYVKRLFVENDSLFLRYEFSEKFQLEAEAGTQQGIDLIYQVEK